MLAIQNLQTPGGQGWPSDVSTELLQADAIRRLHVGGCVQ